MTVRELVTDLRDPVTVVAGSLDVAVTSLATDSRTVKPGAMFFALPGTRTDGRRFVDEALARGAAAVVVPPPAPAAAATCVIESPRVRATLSEMAARFCGHPSRRVAVVGVTGTNGKTTTTYLLESILRAAGHRPGVIGTITYRCGERTWPAPFTTPEAIELQRLLGEMADAGASHVVMEVSSHSLVLDRVRDCDFDGGLFTNLTRDHLDFHADMESYFEAKARLFRELLPGSSKPARFAVVNREDAYGIRLLGGLSGRVLTFGQGAEADVAPIEVERSLAGLRGTLRVGDRRLEFSSPLVGEAHLDNILAATAAAHALGVDLDAIAAGIRDCSGVPGRMERVDERAPFAVLVDYAHTPDALERAVRVLRALAEGRLVVVFGCGGDRDRGKRPLMGEIAARLADLVILTSDNPRTEDPLRILHEIEQGTRETGLELLQEPALAKPEASGYLVVPDRRRAIRLAIRSARPGDVVLIAGKGHEDYQIIGAERSHFDDREEARRCLEELVAA